MPKGDRQVLKPASYLPGKYISLTRPVEEVSEELLRTIVNDYSSKFREMQSKLEQVHLEMEELQLRSQNRSYFSSVTPEKPSVIHTSHRGSLGWTYTLDQTDTFARSAVSNNSSALPDLKARQNPFQSQLNRLVEEKLKQERPIWQAALQNKLLEELQQKYISYEQLIQSLTLETETLEKDYHLMQEHEKECQQIWLKADEMKSLIYQRDQELKSLENKLTVKRQVDSRRKSHSPEVVSSIQASNRTAQVVREFSLIEKSIKDLREEIRKVRGDDKGSSSEEVYFKSLENIEKEEQAIQSLRDQLATFEQQASAYTEDRKLREEMLYEQGLLKSAAQDIQQAEKERALLYSKLEQVRLYADKDTKYTQTYSNQTAGLSFTPNFATRFEQSQQPILTEVWRDKYQRDNQDMALESKTIQTRILAIRDLEIGLQDYHSKYQTDLGAGTTVEAYDSYLVFLTDRYTRFVEQLVASERENGSRDYDRIGIIDRTVERWKESYFSIKSEELEEFKKGRRTKFSPVKKYESINPHSHTEDNGEINAAGRSVAGMSHTSRHA